MFVCHRDTGNCSGSHRLLLAQFDMQMFIAISRRSGSGFLVSEGQEILDHCLESSQISCWCPESGSWLPHSSSPSVTAASGTAVLSQQSKQQWLQPRWLCDGGLLNRPYSAMTCLCWSSRSWYFSLSWVLAAAWLTGHDLYTWLRCGREGYRFVILYLIGLCSAVFLSNLSFQFHEFTF